jgi:hypothetical protein
VVPEDLDASGGKGSGLSHSPRLCHVG